MKKIFLLILVTTAIFFVGCKKESFITSADARLAISVDSLRFDTIFTTTGSITKSFKILNNNDQKLLVSKIKLGGGNISAYKMNVNGIASAEVNNTEIGANDSIYVFITVTINPTATNLPFIVADSVLINYNGQNRYVQLEAFGQNAVFIRNGLIANNVTFTNTQPYVILGGLQVATGATLTVNAGAKIYCHADAPILVDGTLLCNGTFAQPILFTGDRLDEPYNSFPAAWPGIYFRESSVTNTMQFTNILNAYQAIVVLQPNSNANPKLTLKQCKIDNAFDAGILSSNSSVTAQNCLLSNCGKGVNISYGGTYNFTNCTIANYSNNYILHKNASVFASNFNENNQTNSATITLQNCIVFGDSAFVKNEIVAQKMGNSSFAFSVNNCLYRNLTSNNNVNILQSINNVDPLFDSIDVNRRIFDFHTTINPAAPGINKGLPTPLLIDLDNKNRAVGLPDLGAYEKQ